MGVKIVVNVEQIQMKDYFRAKINVNLILAAIWKLFSGLRLRTIECRFNVILILIFG